MHYIFGDIHGCFENLKRVYGKASGDITGGDTLVFLGDYIDRGPHSFEVIEYLIMLAGRHNCVFLAGNHEDMFMRYLSVPDNGHFMANGGSATVTSYRKNMGSLTLPDTHRKLFETLETHYETEEFIAVHAGLDPTINNMEDQSRHDMTWIRDLFFKSAKCWEKLIVFGHTPCSLLHNKMTEVYFNARNNITGIDTGACYGGILTCLRLPDNKIYQG